MTFLMIHGGVQPASRAAKPIFKNEISIEMVMYTFTQPAQILPSGYWTCI